MDSCCAPGRGPSEDRPPPDCDGTPAPAGAGTPDGTVTTRDDAPTPPDERASATTNDTTTPPNGTITATPANTTTDPPDEAVNTALNGATAVPDDTTTAPDNTTTPPDERASATTSGATTPPDGTVTAPDDTTTLPEERASAATNDTTAAPGDTTSLPDKTVSAAPNGATAPPNEAVNATRNGATAVADGMVTVPAGEFRMGGDASEAFPADGEGPVRAVRLSAFRISATCVTNEQWAEFADATGYVTDAERFGWSFVFDGLLHPAARRFVIDGSVPGAPWWRGVRRTTWRCPAGPGSTLDGLEQHPVVHVSWHDAVAYARWRGMRLPTEAEWERAARGGLDQATYPWGDELTPGGEHRANIWQGRFPGHNTCDDGWYGTAPVRAFPPNGLGLHNVAGNVWEWTADWFSPTWHRPDLPKTRIDPAGPPTGTARVIRGGSYLCHVSYCNRYRVAARTQSTPDSSLGHTGFRVAADA